MQPPEIGVDGLSMFSVSGLIVAKPIDELLHGGHFIDGVLLRPVRRHSSLRIGRPARER